ncbi:RNA polymerase sigma factor [bacterium AH-315-J21]|nr:RNA polymerase sigma factor [bacterium AH-315-J21]
MTEPEASHTAHIKKAQNKETASEDLDRRIVRILMENRERGMDLLAKTYYRKAYGIAIGIVGNRDDAMDVTQETFIRVQKSFETFDTTREFFPWFYTILSNLCRTSLTRRGRAANREVEFDDLQLSAKTASNPETEMLMKEQLTQLRKALSELSFDDREIITLKTFHDFSYDEIAKTLKIPRGTVMSRLYYARKRLAENMNTMANSDSNKLEAK